MLFLQLTYFHKISMKRHFKKGSYYLLSTYSVPGVVLRILHSLSHWSYLVKKMNAIPVLQLKELKL